MHYCSLFINEHYFLSLLFTIILNVKSFKNLQIVNEILYLIFKTVYIKLELLENDKK